MIYLSVNPCYLFICLKIQLDILIRFLCYLTAEMKQGSMLSWGDLVEAEEARMPGHGVHMHEKLSSPSRKRFYYLVLL